MVNFSGTSGVDTIDGTAYGDNISGAAGSWAYFNNEWVFIPSLSDPADTGGDTLNGGGGWDYILGYGGNDHIDGGAGRDRIWGGDGYDTLIGGGDNDTFIFRDSDEMIFGDSIDGGTGTDTLSIEGSGLYSFFYSSLTSIESLVLKATAVVEFDADQIGLGLVSPFLGIKGSGDPVYPDEINIYMRTDTSVNISQWVFTNWDNASDRLHIVGDGDNESITGSVVNDVIHSGGGTDNLYGHTGDDEFVFKNGQDAYSNFVINGGSGNDTIVLDNGDPQSPQNPLHNMIWANILNIENIRFESYGFPQNVQLSLHSRQIGGGDLADNLHVEADGKTTTTEEIKIFIYGSSTNVNLSGWTFTGWNGNNLISIQGNLSDDVITGSSQDDYIQGHEGNDTIYISGGSDEIHGWTGIDTFVFDNGITASGSIDGGNDNDTLEFRGGNGSHSYDITSGLTLSSIEKIHLVDGADLTIYSSQLGSGISYGLSLIGTEQPGSQEILRVLVDTPYVFADAWTLVDWGGQADFISYETSSADENISGSSGNDVIILKGGNDSINTLNGDDTYILTGGFTLQGDLRGGSGYDVLDFGAYNGTWDARNLVHSFIEEIALSGPGTTHVLYSAAQMTGYFPANLLLRGANAPGNTEIFEIRMETETALDISGWTFANWGGQGDYIKIVGDDDDEIITGSSVADNIITAGGKDIVDSGAGNDTVITDAGRDFVQGGPGDDLIKGGGAVDTLYGDAGADTIHGGTSGDTIYGGDNDDIIYGNGGDDIIHGGDGADTVDGGKHVDEIYGNVGNDILKGGGGGDFIDGGLNNDIIYGNSGHDVLKGGDGTDIIYGNTGSDDLFGNIGDDTLHGGWGYDDMWGGGGVDTFVFKKRDWADRVKDFEDDVDIIDLTDWGFASVADALSYATEIKGHVKFDFSSLPGAGSKDYLWVENITIAALQDDILV